MVDAMIPRVGWFVCMVSLCGGLRSLCFVDTATLFFVSVSLRSGDAWCATVGVISGGNAHVAVVAGWHPMFMGTVSTTMRGRPTGWTYGVRCRVMAAVWRSFVSRLIRAS